jgi:PAS domain S-box-containing protein
MRKGAAIGEVRVPSSSLPTLHEPMLGGQESAGGVAHIYETILGTTEDFAYIFDPSGRFLYANAPLLKVWAKTLDQVIGKTCYELGYPTWHADMHMREIEEIVRTKTQIRGEVPFTGGSGISGVYDYIFKPVLDASGEVEIIVGSTRDVTVRKQDEEKLKAAQLELQKKADELFTICVALYVPCKATRRS